jgi:hypothetical protein
MRGSRPLAARWEGDVVARVASNGDWTRATASNAAHLDARADNPNGRDRLLLFTSAPPTSEATVALFAALDAALAPEHVADASAPLIDDATLARWSRVAVPASAQPAPAQGDASDARWLWFVVLAALAIEWLLRARLDAARTPQGAHVAR